MKHGLHSCKPLTDPTKLAIERVLRQAFKRTFTVEPINEHYRVTWARKPGPVALDECLEHAGLRCDVTQIHWNCDSQIGVLL